MISAVRRHLVHYPIYLLVRGASNWLGIADSATPLHSFLAILVAIVAVVVVSDISFGHIEAPLRRFGRDCSIRMREAAANGAAAPGR